MNLNEELLTKALWLDLEDRVEFPPDFYEPHQFSRKFERHIKRMIVESDRPKTINFLLKAGKRIAIIIATLLIITATIVIGVEGFRKEFFKFVEERFDEFSRVFFVSEAKINHGIFEAHYPSYIPDLDLAVVEQNENNKVYIYYCSNEGDDLLYQQLWIDEATIGLNTEGVTLEKDQEVGEYKAIYLTNKGNHTVIWDDGIYCYMVTSNISRETVFKVAESVK